MKTTKYRPHKAPRKRYTEDVREFLAKRPNQHVHVGSLVATFGIHEKQVQNAISRIKQQFENEDTNEALKTVTRGQTWMYVPYPDTSGEPQEHRVTVQLTQETLDDFQPGPETEPLAQFKVIGSLYERNTNSFKGTVVQAESQGFSGIYLLTSL